MFSKLKRKTLALNFFLIVLVLSIGYSPGMRSEINSASATSPAIVSQIRGDTYSDAALSDGNHMWTGGLEPWMKASNGTFVPYILSQNSTHYIVDNKEAPFIINKNNCITSIYDNSVPLSQNPASIIGKEWWDVSYHTNTSPLFINMDLSSTICTISVTTNSSGIFIDTLKAFPAGTLEVTYEKIIGKPWETILIPTNTLPASNYSIKPIERISGINADRIMVGTATFDSTVALSSQINQSSSMITIHKGVKSFVFDERNALANFKQLNITKTSSGFSLSTDFGSNIPILSANQKFTIDPTFGYSAGSEKALSDDVIVSTSCASTGIIATGLNYLELAKTASSPSNGCIVSYGRWDVTSIPTGSTINNATLEINVVDFGGSINCDYAKMITHDPNSATLSQVWADIMNGTAYVSNDNKCMTTGSGKIILLGSTANADIHNQLSAGWFAIGVRYHNMVRDGSYHTTVAQNYANTDMTLQIVYTTVPSQVTGLTVINQTNSAINLSWTAPNNGGSTITGYKVQRASNTWVDVTNSTGSALTKYNATSLSSNTKYVFRVAAWNGIGLGTYSSNVTGHTFANPPFSLSVNPTSVSQFRINWTAPGGNDTITGYKIERQTNGGSFSTLVSNTGNSTTHYDNTGLSMGTTYGYRIFAINGAGTGNPSIIISATSPITSSDTRLDSSGIQRASYFDGTTQWVFYYDGSNILYRYSSDSGTTLSASSSTSSGSLASNSYFTVYGESNKVVISYATSSNVLTKIGTITGTSISWSSPVTVYSVSGTNSGQNFYPAFEKMSSNLFLGFNVVTGGLGTERVYNSTTLGSAWSYDTTFSAAQTNPASIALVKYSNNTKLVAIVARYDSGEFQYSTYNGTGWSTQVYTTGAGLTNNAIKSISMSAASNGTCAWVGYVKDNSGGSLKTMLFCNPTHISFPATGITTTNLEPSMSQAGPNMRLFYVRSNDIYAITHNATSWGPEFVLFANVTNASFPHGEKNGYGGNHVPVVWREGNSSPYTVRFKVDTNLFSFPAYISEFEFHYGGHGTDAIMAIKHPTPPLGKDTFWARAFENSLVIAANNDFGTVGAGYTTYIPLGQSTPQTVDLGYAVDVLGASQTYYIGSTPITSGQVEYAVLYAGNSCWNIHTLYFIQSVCIPNMIWGFPTYAVTASFNANTDPQDFTSAQYVDTTETSHLLNTIPATYNCFPIKAEILNTNEITFGGISGCSISPPHDLPTVQLPG